MMAAPHSRKLPTSRTSLRYGFGLTVLLLLSSLGCSNGSESTSGAEDTLAVAQPAPLTPNLTLPGLLESDARFSTLRAALDSTGLRRTLEADSMYTMLAPPNEAFDRLAPEQRMRVFAPAALEQVLRYHVGKGRTPLSPNTALQTLQGASLNVVANGDTLRVGGATVLAQAVETRNGLLYVIDRVLIPPNLAP